MGIGFVLLVWLILGACVAVVASAVAAGLVVFLTRRAKELRRRAVIVALCFPFAILVYTFGAFMIYATISESRGYDAVIGDTWRVPLGHGASLVMIDTPEPAFVATDSDQSHFGLTSLASNGQHVFGTHPSPPSFFSLDLVTGAETSYPDQQSFRSAAATHGMQPQDLLPPEEYYSRHRWHVFDHLFLLGAACVPPLGALFLLASLTRKVRRERA